MGLALSPATPPELLSYLLPYLELVLIMALDPGFVGQKFIPEVISKVEKVREMAEEKGLDLDIAVDGGIGENTVPPLKRAGANVFVAGTTSIFSGRENVEKAALEFKQFCEEC